MDFVRIGYFIPLNGPLNGHPPGIIYVRKMAALVMVYIVQRGATHNTGRSEFKEKCSGGKDGMNDFQNTDEEGPGFPCNAS